MTKLPVRDKNVGSLQSSQIKGLAGRRAGDGNIRIFFRQTGEYGMLVSLPHKITVDLVTDYDHTMFHTDISDPAQFFLCPDTPHRIVRTAK